MSQESQTASGRFSAIKSRLFSAGWKQWLPSRGNLIFTVLIVLVFAWGQSRGVFADRLQQTTINTRPIPYQGRLADAAGNPLTNTYPMIFRLYAASTVGEPLWIENWSGPNSVRVSDGLFSVMLGSLTPIPETVITSNANLWLGITVGTDNEMTPRIQLGTVPYSQQAQTVPDGSITSVKIADGSIQRADLAADAVPPSIPVGTVISWWRADANTPLPSGEWAFADGSVVSDLASPLKGKALPDLRNRFIMGVDGAQIGLTGGNNTVDLSHGHTLPPHSHTFSADTGGPVTGNGGYYDRNNEARFANNTYITTWYVDHHHQVSGWTSEWSGSSNVTTQMLDNRPAYVGLVYLVKIK